MGNVISFDDLGLAVLMIIDLAPPSTDCRPGVILLIFLMPRMPPFLLTCAVG